METKKSYSEQLKDPRWQKKRLEIMNRDNFCCSKCGDTMSTLVVHHKEYINGRKAWEYDNINLITLCELCHEIEHNEIKIIEYIGFLNPLDAIKFIPELNKYFCEIGNHKGCWTLILRKNAIHEEAELVLFKLMGFAYYDDCFEYYSNDRIGMIYYNSTNVDEKDEHYQAGVKLSELYFKERN